MSSSSAVSSTDGAEAISNGTSLKQRLFGELNPVSRLVTPVRCSDSYLQDPEAGAVIDAGSSVGKRSITCAARKPDLATRL